MPSPSDRQYTDSHEWMKAVSDEWIIGVTQFAVNALSDVTYVALPAIGKTFALGDVLGEVESVKATSDIYSPIAGVITAVNTDLQKDPALLNTDPYEAGWLVKLKSAHTDGGNFMDAAAYDASNPI